MRFRKFALAVATFMAAPACDCNRTTAQLQAQRVMVATVLSTPSITISREAIAGLDASVPALDAGLPSFDGGCPFDGGCALDGGLPISFDGGSVTLAEQTGLFVFFGTRQGGSLTMPPVPVANTTLRAETGGQTFELQAHGAGTHTLTSQGDPSLRYVSGATWKFTAVAESQSFVGEVEGAPPQEHISQLHPSGGYVDLAAGTEYRLTRPDAPEGQERLLGFVTVVPISAFGQQGEPTYTNVPTTPLGFLKLVAAPSEWKQTVVVIPGAAFPERDRNYVIVVQSAKLGFASSDNLFIGSAMIAGVADVGVVKTRP